MNSGRLVILSGPSGVGKDTVIDAWKVKNPRVQRVVAYTTRQPRAGETHCIDYHFVTPEEFHVKADNGDFLWRVDRFVHRGLGTPVIWGDRIVVGDAQDYVHILAKADGRTLGRIELDSPLVAPPVVAGDLLLVLTRKGTVSALRIN